MRLRDLPERPPLIPLKLAKGGWGGRGGTNVQLHLEVGEGREGGFGVKGKGTDKDRQTQHGGGGGRKGDGTLPAPIPG